MRRKLRIAARLGGNGAGTATVEIVGGTGLEGSGAWAFDGVERTLGAVVGCVDGVAGEAVHAGGDERGVGGEGGGVGKEGGGMLGLVLRVQVVVDMLHMRILTWLLLLLLHLRVLLTL